jgi:hypothetical protein
VHNDLIRNNVAWQAYGATRFAVKRVRGRKPAAHEARVVVVIESKGVSLLKPAAGLPASNSTPRIRPQKFGKAPNDPCGAMCSWKRHEPIARRSVGRKGGGSGTVKQPHELRD